MEQLKSLEEMDVWEHPPWSGIIRNEEKNKKFSEENQADSLIHPHVKMTQHRTMRKLKTIFWSVTGDFFYRHHVEPRVKLYMPKEESFPIPLKYIDVTRNTHTSLDVMLEKNIDDYWNVDGESELQDAWTSFTAKGHLTWSGERRGNK